MRLIILLVSILITGKSSLGQDARKDSIRHRKIEYYFLIQSGTLIGCNSCSSGKQISFSGATTHGIKVGKKLRLGSGIGLDSYFGWNTLPVFGSASWDLIGKKNALFVELNYGGALTSWRPQDYQEYGYVKTNSGRMYSYGLGYRIKYENMRVSLGIGHKTQRVTSYYEYPTYYWNNNSLVAGDPSRKVVKNEMNRLQVWLAIGWK